jgi:hypothetical protein
METTPFEILQNLIKENRASIKLKKDIPDNFLLWMSIYYKNRFFKILTNTISIFYNDIFGVWIPILLGFFMGWKYLLIIPVYLILKYFTKQLGQAFLIYDCMKSESFFITMWNMKYCGIFLTKQRYGLDFLIDPTLHSSWEYELLKNLKE